MLILKSVYLISVQPWTYEHYTAKISKRNTPVALTVIGPISFISSPQVQIHGSVSLSENVECIVVNSRHQKDPRTTTLLDRFVEQNKCNLIWMDPDDLAGAAPYFSSGHHELGLFSSLSDPFSRTTRRRRGRGHSRSRRKHPY